MMHTSSWEQPLEIPTVSGDIALLSSKVAMTKKAQVKVAVSKCCSSTDFSYSIESYSNCSRHFTQRIKHHVWNNSKPPSTVSSIECVRGRGKYAKHERMDRSPDELPMIDVDVLLEDKMDVPISCQEIQSRNPKNNVDSNSAPTSQQEAKPSEVSDADPLNANPLSQRSAEWRRFVSGPLRAEWWKPERPHDVFGFVRKDQDRINPEAVISVSRGFKDKNGEGVIVRLVAQLITWSGQSDTLRKRQA